MDYDLVIRNGTVVEGTRLPRFRADIGIKDGRVARIGRIPANVTAGRELDAQGCVVAPGFVDLHTHYDAQLHWDPYCTTSGWHGVTSVAIGNCGFGFAPVKPEARERSMMMMTRVEQIPYESMKAAMKWNWESFPQWLDAVDALPKGVNVVNFMPLSPLLVYVMGLEAAKSRPATPQEQAEMKRLLHEAMDAGAVGFSLQRLGKLSQQADVDGTPMPTDNMFEEDILALAEVLRERDEGVIQISQASSGDPFAPTEGSRALDHQVLERVAMAAQRPVLHNAVLPLTYAPNQHHYEMNWVHRANEKGLRIFAQGNHYRSYFEFTLERWNLYDTSAAWNKSTQGTIAEKMAMMSDPKVRAQMKEEHQLLALAGLHAMPENLTVVEVPDAPQLEKYLNRKVGEIAAELGQHPADTMLDLALANELRTKFRTEMITSDDAKVVAPLVADPFLLPGMSDGGAHTKFFTGGSWTTDMLTWLVRDSKELSLEEAHYHLSYLPAQAAGLIDRGFIKEGAPADIVVYNLDELERTPEFGGDIVHDLPANEWRLVQYSKGYRWTIVNGEITFEDSKCTGATPGKLLRNGKIASQAWAIAAE